MSTIQEGTTAVLADGGLVSRPSCQPRAGVPKASALFLALGKVSPRRHMRHATQDAKQQVAMYERFLDGGRGSTEAAKCAL